MKTLILTSALVVLTTLSFAQFPQVNAPDSSSYVTDDLRVAIFQQNDSIVHLKMAKKSGDLVKIRIMEEGNKLPVHQRRVKTYAAADLVYDLREFPEGEYVFEIVMDKEVVYTKKVARKNTKEAYATK
jgi:hypothetical protein